MDILIDWMSFTIETDAMEESVGLDTIDSVWSRAYQDAFATVSNQLVELIGEPEACASRAPYNHAWRHQLGMTYAHPALTHILFEIDGRGCDLLRENSLTKLLILKFADRLSRIDIAVDVCTTVQPALCAEIADFSRFKAHSFIESKTGSTLYVGSRKSHRYLRCYRFNAPHPRHESLRFEFVYRKDNAKHVGRQLVESRYDIASLAKQSLCDFGFWSVAAFIDGEKFSTVVRKVGKEKAGTIGWLITQCAPAFKRLVNQNIITNPDDFLREYFLS